MADKDNIILQENALGQWSEKRIVPVAGSVLGWDGSKNPTTVDPTAHTHPSGAVIVAGPCVLGRDTSGAGAVEELAAGTAGRQALGHEDLLSLLAFLGLGPEDVPTFSGARVSGDVDAEQYFEFAKGPGVGIRWRITQLNNADAPLFFTSYDDDGTPRARFAIERGAAGKTYWYTPLNATDTTESTSTTTGGVVVAGGLGVAKNINYGGRLAGANGDVESGFREICGARLSLSSTDPCHPGITGAGILYLLPHKSNLISLYVNGAWCLKAFSTIGYNLSSLAANTNYDVFALYSGLQVEMELVAWSTDTARATALARQDGVFVLSGAPNKRYIGTIRTTSVAGTTEDSAARRFVWNAYNRIPRRMHAFINSLLTYTCNTSSWRQANANADMKCEVVCGLTEEPTEWGLSVIASVTSGKYFAAVLRNGSYTTTVFPRLYFSLTTKDGQSMRGADAAVLGYTYWAWSEVQVSGGTATIDCNGDAQNYPNSGLTGIVYA